MYYKQLDGLRCLCVMGVLFQHFIHPFISKYFLTALIGVDLFFIISGFLITENLIKLKETKDFKIAIKIFYLKRTLRIFPLYYLYLGIIAVFFFKDYASVLPWGLLYGINFYIIHFGVDQYLVGHLWSLAVEEQFYIVWPLLILFTNNTKLRKYTLSLLAIGILFTSWNLITGKDYNVNYMHPLSCAVALLSGALLAILKKEKNKAFYFFNNKMNLFFFFFIFSALGIGYLCGKNILQPEYKILIRIATCILGFAIIPSVAKNEINGVIGKIISSDIAIYIGKISYGIYIYNLIVYQFMRPYIETWFTELCKNSVFESSLLKYIKYNPTFFQFPIYSLGVIALASVSYHLFEKRFLNLKDKFN